MKRRLRLLALFLLSCLAPIAATAQECTAANEHPPLTALDHASMIAAYTASFQGLYGRAPSMQAGSGVDDGNYWVAVSDHYGAFSDGICRAGWSAYWETKLGTNAPSASPALGDQPARFLPGVTPQPVPQPTPVPQPQPVPAPQPPLNIDYTALVTQLATLNAQVNACNVGIANVNANVSAGRQENQSFFASVKSVWAQVGGPLLKYVVPAVGAYVAGKKL